MDPKPREGDEWSGIVSKFNVTSDHSVSIMQEYISLGGYYCFENLLPHWDLYNVIYGVLRSIPLRLGQKNNNTAVH